MFSYDPKQYPEVPGVYRMLGANDQVIYIGKAINLRKRLSQYFIGGHDGRYQLHLLLRDVERVDVVAVPTEKDALILENQMIKREKPRYNIRLKDDKTFPYIRISKDAYPRVEVSRERGDPQYDTYGPYTSPAVAHRMVELMSRQFGLRRCPGVPLKLLDRPCLYAQMGQCSAPCVAKIDEPSYGEDVTRARDLLAGKTGHLMKEAKARMEAASEAMEYEQAASHRDLWKALRQFDRGGVMENGVHEEVDVFSCVSHGGWHLVCLIQVRRGELWNNENFELRAMETWEEQANSFLLEVYAHREIPKKVVVDFELEEMATMRELLAERAGMKVQLTRPQRGELRSWLAVARQNARAELSCRRVTGALDETGYLDAVQKECSLPRRPNLAIALDCANFSKEEPVGCIVVFKDGKPDKSSYRKFKVRGDVAELGDVHHIQEVLQRYLAKCDEQTWPDVMLIDGGKEQLAAAARAIRTVGRQPDRSLMAISKGPQRKSGDELLHFFGDDQTLNLRSASTSMSLWTELRDEAHRTSNQFNGRRLEKSRLQDPFSKLPGIGAVTSKKMRSMFGSMKSFLASDVAVLEDLKWLSRRQKNMLIAYHSANQRD